MKIRFFLDENVPVEIARQLNRRQIDTVTVRDLGMLGLDDRIHLDYAVQNGYVVCTHDHDFLAIVLQGVEHAGIVFGQQQTFDWKLGNLSDPDF